MKKLIVLLMILFTPHCLFAAQQTWSSGDQLSDIRTKLSENDTDLYGQAATKWATGTVYTANNQLVAHGGYVFVCITNHTASAAGAVGNEPGFGDGWTSVWRYSGQNLYEPLKTSDENYVTDAEKAVIGNTSGTNTGDQTSVSGNAGTATALAANGGNCSAGQAALGVDASGVAEGCWTPESGAMTWPSTAGIPYWTSGAAWGGAYNATTKIPTNYVTNLSGTNTGDQNAAGVSIADAGNYFTGTTVEAATQELGAKLPTGTDGTRRLILADNPSGIAPTAAAWEIYSDAGVWKMNTSGTEHTIPRSPLAGQITFTGPTAARDFALPDAAATILTSNAAVTVAQGGTGRATGTTAYSLVATGTTATGAQQTLANGATTEVLVGGGASALPVWTTATGSGAPVRATSPTLVTPNLGTPSSITLTNGTGLPLSGVSDSTTEALGAGTVELGHASDTTIARSGAGAVTVEGVAVPTISSTSTLTNKTLDVEGTGNAITTVEKIWFAAAGCNNATAATFFDLPTANAPASACITGTNTQKAVLDYDAATDESGQITLALPTDFTGAVDVKYKWLAVATSGNVVWAVQTICVADAETDDPAFNTASTVTDAAKGTTLQTNDAAITGVTTTGCAAGELMHLRFFRDADNASDTMTGDARLIGAEVTLRRAQ